MAHPHLSETRATFAGRIHRTKNRLVAVPAEVQRLLGLERRPENHILLVSIRPSGKGRWNHHYVKLTKVHRVIRDVEAGGRAARPSGAGLLVALAAEPRAEWREEGSSDVDERLREEIGGPDRPR
jgi:hypothetical protein